MRLISIATSVALTLITSTAFAVPVTQEAFIIDRRNLDIFTYGVPGVSFRVESTETKTSYQEISFKYKATEGHEFERDLGWNDDGDRLYYYANTSITESNGVKTVVMDFSSFSFLDEDNYYKFFSCERGYDPVTGICQKFYPLSFSPFFDYGAGGLPDYLVLTDFYMFGHKVILDSFDELESWYYNYDSSVSEPDWPKHYYTAQVDASLNPVLAPSPGVVSEPLTLPLIAGIFGVFAALRYRKKS